jgi:cytochrome-b5 reductase
MFARLASAAPRAARAAAGVSALGWAAASASSSSASCDAASSSSSSSAVALSPSDFRPFRLLAREQLTPDTSRFSFALPSESAELGLPVAACLQVRVPDPADAAKFLVRPYTPTSAADARGAFELVVKTYEPGGRVSKAFGALKVGDSLEMKGPFVKFAYEANAQAALALVAGGTGIAPMVQLLRAILDNPRDRTEVRLVYASKTPADVILKAELDALALTHPNFKVLYTVRRLGPNHRTPHFVAAAPRAVRQRAPARSREPFAGDGGIGGASAGCAARQRAASWLLRMRVLPCAARPLPTAYPPPPPPARPFALAPSRARARAGHQGAGRLRAVERRRGPRDQGDAGELPAAAAGGRRRQGCRVRAAGLHEGRERREEEPERPGRALGHAQGAALRAERGHQDVEAGAAASVEISMFTRKEC